MAHYRKIDVRIWNDAKFRALSDNGKLVFFFILTHPHLTALGAMRATVAGLSAELGWKPEAFAKAFGEALAKGLLEHDENACFVGAPNFLRYNRPESPNVVKSWSGALDLLPECNMKAQLLKRVKGFTEGLPKAFAEALPEAFAKGMPNQEQEHKQEHKQEQEQKNKAAVAAGDVAIPPELDTPEVRNAVERWLRHKRQIGNTYKSAETASGMFGDFVRAGPAAFVAAVNHSIGQNYKGIYAPSGSKNGNAGTPSAGKEFSRDARGDL